MVFCNSDEGSHHKEIKLRECCIVSKEIVDIGGSYPRRGPQHRPRDPCRQSSAQPRHCRALGNHHVSLHHFIWSKSPCFLWFWLPVHLMVRHQVDAHADINTPASSTSGNMHGMPVRSPTIIIINRLSLFRWVFIFLASVQTWLLG